MVNPRIERVWAREVLDSRGNPTVEAEIRVLGHDVRAIAPSGASTGTFEALEMRDKDSRFHGKGVMKAVTNIRDVVSKRLEGMDPSDQKAIDEALIELDGTENKSRLGGNAITAVSLAAAKAGAMVERVPLYEHLGQGKVLPVPFFNIINGGKHAGGDLAIQEFMAVAAGAKSFAEALRMGSEVYWSLKSVLKKRYGAAAINIGDEGGFAPPLDTTAEALQVIMDAIEDAGYVYGKDVYLALDAASSEFYQSDGYHVDGMVLTPGELIDHYVSLVNSYPLVSIEDPMHEDQFAETAELTKRLEGKAQVIGDDLFVTNVKRLRKGIEMGSANCLLLKVNQIGTLSESFDAARMAYDAGYGVLVSHRSGETEDTSIADISVSLASGQIKTGAPARGERTAKYNRLLRIEEQLGAEAIFPGAKAFLR